MVDRSRPPALQAGYLRLKGRGGCSVQEMRELLDVLDKSYQAVAQVELAAYSSLVTAERVVRFEGPRRYLVPWWNLAPSLPDSAVAADQLVVHRVVLRSPGFWEFMGTLNPLEVLRKYLNDRHERRKDREYRELAENRGLEIENALGELEVIRKLAELEREFGPDYIPEEVRQRIWAAEVRGPLQELDDFARRGVINGGSATAGRELPPSDRKDA